VVTDMSGWVDQSGAQHGEKSFVVSEGQLARGEMTYDKAAALNVTVVTDAGYGLPASLPSVNYERPNGLEAATRVIVPSAGLTTSVTGLWPDLDGYSVWAGACDDSDPAGPPTSGSRVAPVVVPGGGTGSVDARLAPVDITVTRDTSGVLGPAAGANVTAVSQSCAAGPPEATLFLGQTDGNGVLKSSLPYGEWVLSVSHEGFTAASEPFVPDATDATAVDVTVVG
jgi:hypothetical protein